jgi:hypothetical protein
MRSAAHGSSDAMLLDQGNGIWAELASLQQAGAAKFDPVHMHYLQALAKRAVAHQGKVRRVVDGKLAQALTTFKDRFTQARSDAEHLIATVTPQHPKTAAKLQPLLDTGDFKGVRQCVAKLESTEPRPSLGDLARLMAQHAPEPVDAGLEGMLSGVASLRPELKTTRYFRDTWSRLSVEKRVTQALHLAPKNAGPINSHSLVLRSLALMRDISPDYLNQLTSYVDTLLCLDQCVQEKPGNANKPAEGDHSKKAKGRRTARKTG